MKIHEKLKQLREVNQWSQEDMAEKIHVTPSSYSKIERGETRLTLERLEQLAEVFNVDISKLIQPDSNFYYQINENADNNKNGQFYTDNKDDFYQMEIEKLQLIIKHKEELNLKLQEQIQDLRELNNTLKKAKS